MLNKKEKEVIRDCAKDLYKLIAELSMESQYDEAAYLKEITDKLEGLLDD